MAADSGIDITDRCVDGGIVRPDLLSKRQAAVVETAAGRPVIPEATAFGVPCEAWLATGVFDSLTAVRASVTVDRIRGLAGVDY